MVNTITRVTADMPTSLPLTHPAGKPRTPPVIRRQARSPTTTTDVLGRELWWLIR
jgi:hypothetical protein